MKPLLSALENRLSIIFHVQVRLSLALNETYHCFDLVWHCNYVMCTKVLIFQKCVNLLLLHVTDIIHRLQGRIISEKKKKHVPS